MAKYLINGGFPLVGSVRVSGAKNSALKLMAASVMTTGKVTLHNVPLIKDVFTMADVLREIGADVTIGPDSVEIDASGELHHTTPYELVRKMLSLIHISEPTRLRRISYAVFCLKKKKAKNNEITCTEQREKNEKISRTTINRS